MKPQDFAIRRNLFLLIFSLPESIISLFPRRSRDGGRRGRLREVLEQQQKEERVEAEVGVTSGEVLGQRGERHARSHRPSLVQSCVTYVGGGREMRLRGSGHSLGGVSSANGE